jgi:cytochrome d ubiquinol oxidase subunit II
MEYTSGFWYLLNPYGFIGGIFSVLGCLLHGSVFLSLKTTGDLEKKVKSLSKMLWTAALIGALLMFAASIFYVDYVERLGFGLVVPVLAFDALVLARIFIQQEKFGWAFAMTAATIALGMVTHFLTIFPDVMISTTNPDFSLTIYRAASSPYTLEVISIVAAVFVPVMLIYQVWSYRAFRKRVTADPQKLEY